MWQRHYTKLDFVLSHIQSPRTVLGAAVLAIAGLMGVVRLVQPRFCSRLQSCIATDFKMLQHWRQGLGVMQHRWLCATTGVAARSGRADAGGRVRNAV